MNMRAPKSPKASSKKEEETPDRFRINRPPTDAQDCPKSESRDQPKNSPAVHSDSSTSPNGSTSNEFTQHNGSHPGSSFPPSEILPTSQTAAAMIIPPAMQVDSRQRKLLHTADRLPPVTKRTLSELDLDRIMRNINLRVDVNFDRSLHFMPVDGTKALDRRRAAAAYYEALAIEMSIYAFGAAHGLSCDKPDDDSISSFEPRLPIMLGTLQEVLSTLVPERDHYCVTENLDVALMMQQIRKGVLDLAKLARWLGSLLKTHCAPMRDAMVDRMVAEISEGCQSRSMCQVAQGLQTMFGALEAMKLDVANHQIRAFRIVLVEDTVRFLHTHFLGRMAMRTINVEPARQWYLGLLRQESTARGLCHTDSFGPVAVFFRGTLSLLLRHDPPKTFPETFEFDVGRLRRLRNDIQDVICLEICCDIFREIATARNRQVSIPTEISFALRTSLWSIIEDSEPSVTESARWQRQVPTIALEIARAIRTVENDITDEGISKCGIRVKNLDQDVLRLAEDMLESSFTAGSTLFTRFQNCARFRLETDTLELAKRYLLMSPLEICNAQLHRTLATRSQFNEFENIAKRVAHIGVLHWKVWAPLLYVREEGPVFEPQITLWSDDIHSSTHSTEVTVES